MSPSYRWRDTDPDYYAYVDALFIRVQRQSYDTRLHRIRSAGGGTNRDARVLIEIETPNSMNLCNRFKAECKDLCVFVQATGAWCTDEDVCGHSVGHDSSIDGGHTYTAQRSTAATRRRWSIPDLRDRHTLGVTYCRSVCM